MIVLYLAFFVSDFHAFSVRKQQGIIQARAPDSWDLPHEWELPPIILHLVDDATIPLSIPHNQARRLWRHDTRPLRLPQIESKRRHSCEGEVEPGAEQRQPPKSPGCH